MGGVGVHPDSDLVVARLGPLIRMTSLRTFTCEMGSGSGLQRSWIAVHALLRIRTVTMLRDAPCSEVS
jgi:hypothetical protein